MLPNSQCAPALRAQGSRYKPVARNIAREFVFPERGIVFWFCSMLWTAVPETTVHKQCEPHLPENEIGLAKDFLIPPPAGDFVPAKEFCQCYFRVLISASANK
jgi:hypothetical protein